MNSNSYYDRDAHAASGPSADAVKQELALLVEAMEFPRMPQQRRSREKYERLLLGAASLFAERGVDGTSTTEIAARAGVSVGTLYSYFTDKRQILLALVADNASLVLGPAGVEFDFTDDPRGSLQRALEETLPYDPQRSYLRRCWAELTADNAAVAAIGGKIHENLFVRLVDAARRVERRTDFRRGIDVEATAWAVLSLFDDLWHLPNKPGPTGKREFVRRRAAVAELAYNAFFASSATGDRNADTDE